MTPEEVEALYRTQPYLLQQFNAACDSLRAQIQTIADTRKSENLDLMGSITHAMRPPVRTVHFVPEPIEPFGIKQRFSSLGAVVETKLSVQAITPMFNHAVERMRSSGAYIPDHPGLGNSEEQDHFCIAAAVLTSVAEEMNGAGVNLDYTILMNMAAAAASMLF